ncbi:MAG: Ppx/GppA phosphatase family protein [Sulfurovaceae bacterium]|nr:Ppx/GppA phosphatase family protein [Sulfurovaceae bacterium]
MAKRTAIIDIGSNSARLVIFERSSRFGFRLICEQKSKVRIGEGAYSNNGYLQPIGIKRAFLALSAFAQTIQKFSTNNVICVATSALRDAPNAKEFISLIKNELGIQIKIIDGKQEALYGGIAVANLLPCENGITLDIGGGSSDLTLIKNGKIIDTYSLNIGTVRIKELFFDNNRPIDDAKEFIKNELFSLPDNFKHDLVIGIGGTTRAIADAIMQESMYPINKLHGFVYDLETYQEYLENITKSSAKGLKYFALKKDRYDTIREGTIIFLEIIAHMQTKIIMTSGVGVREGVFLTRLLKNNNFIFPKDTNPSLQNILDRFDPSSKTLQLKKQVAKKLYDLCIEHFEFETEYKNELLSALSLSDIGKNLNIYKANRHSFYIALQELNYGFTHKQMIFIATLLRAGKSAKIKKSLYKKYNDLLPSKKTMKWYSFIFILSLLIIEYSHEAKIGFTYDNQTLTIYSDKPLYLIKEAIKEIRKPTSFAIIIKDTQHIPSQISFI